MGERTWPEIPVGANGAPRWIRRHAPKGHWRDDHRRQLSRRLALSAILVLLVAGVAGVASYAVFSATATNPGASPYNQFTTGSVSISDNEATTAMFSLSNLDQGATGSACIAVQYTGTVANGSDVYLYATNVTSTNSLANHITIAVQDGTDTAAFATGDLSCTSFTPNTNTTTATNTTVGNAVPATAIGSWPTSNSSGYLLSSSGSGAPVQTWTTNPTTVWYKFTYAVDSTAPASSQANVQFTWEADGQ